MISVEQPSATFRPAALLAGSPSPRAGHLPFASDLIAALKPSVIVELGVAYGDTYLGFCQLVAEHALNCTCYGVDTWRGATDLAVNGAYDAVSRYNSNNYKKFSHLIRKSFEDALSLFPAESISLLSLDGLHQYEELRHTFDSWVCKIRPGGVILLSDISQRGGDAGSLLLWDELQTSYPHFSFRNNNGLGILCKSQKEADKVPFLHALFHAPRDQQERIRRYYSLCAERLELAARLGASGSADAGCSLLQIFHSQAGEYQTSPELGHVINPGSWINLHLDLPQGTGDHPLRVDVANRPAVVDIATLCLRKADGTVVWNWNPKDVTDSLRVEGTAARMPGFGEDFCRILSLGASPHVFLPDFRGAAFALPLELQIRLRVDLELSAVREMVKAATPAQLEKAKSESAKHLAQARIDHEAKVKQIVADAEATLQAMREEYEQHASRNALQLEEERRAHQAALISRDHLATQQPLMLQEISIAQGNVEELKAEIERLSAEMANMEYELTELRKLSARMAAALEEERSVRTTMQDSSSWQLTKPFRAVGGLFGPRKKY